MSLQSVTPNPFVSSTTLRFELPESGPARLSVYDISGRVVRTLADGQTAMGAHAVRWNGTDDHGQPLPAGIYFARLDALGKTQVRRMVLMK